MTALEQMCAALSPLAGGGGRVLAALDEAAKNHTGVCTLDGSMVDKPMELRARTTLAKAAAAGIKIGGVQA